VIGERADQRAEFCAVVNDITLLLDCLPLVLALSLEMVLFGRSSLGRGSPTAECRTEC
jgi:hypothetical protein